MMDMRMRMKMNIKMKMKEVRGGWGDNPYASLSLFDQSAPSRARA